MEETSKRARRLNRGAISSTAPAGSPELSLRGVLAACNHVKSPTSDRPAEETQLAAIHRRIPLVLD